MKALEKIDVQTTSKLLSDKVYTWYESLISSLPNMALAILVFILFLFLAKALRKVSNGVFRKLNYNLALRNLLISIVHFAVLLIGLFICLELLDLDKTVTSLLAGAGVLGLALGFAFQEIASNFIAGIIIAMREPYRLGDIVEIQTYMGVVSEINLRTTHLTTFDELEVIIPNKTMFTEPFTNYTSTPSRRMDLNVGISYAENLQNAEDITLDAVSTIEGRDMDRAPELYYKEFGDSSINFEVRVWVKYPNNGAFLKARHEAVKNIKSAYDANSITIPFPIRTLDFGIKGGKALKEML